MKTKFCLLSFIFIIFDLVVHAQDLEIITGPFFDSTNYKSPTALKKEIYGIIPITHYQQCNQTWSNNPYGIGNCSSICVNGCAMTSGAMLLKANGVNVNPGQLNSWLQANNGYSGCSVLWTSVDNYPGSTMIWYGSATYSLSIIKSEIDAGNPIIAHVNSSSPCHHFIVVYGYTGTGTNSSDFLVSDPAISSFPSYLSNYIICSETYALRIFHHVYIACTNPPTPTCISPGSLVSPGQNINTLTPTLTWNTVTGATDYDVFIRKDPLNSGPLVLQEYCVSGNIFVVPMSTLVKDGLYRWNVQANVNCNQCENGYSTPLYFKVKSDASIDDNEYYNVINIFPNPSIGIFNIQLNSIRKEKITIEINNTLSQIVYEKQYFLDIGENTIELNLENELKGIYFIKIKTTNSLLTLKELIK